MSTRSRRSLRAFSLAELIVVISIIAILVAIAVPAFSSLVDSSERSLAENQLRVAIGAGRDAAIRSDAGDGAVVFFFANGRIVAVPCVQVGGVKDYAGYTAPGAPDNAAGQADRDLFVPLPNVEPVQMPKGWSIRGYALPGDVNAGAAAVNPDDRHGWYEKLATRVDKGNWVFPETGFYDPQDPQLGEKGYVRQTFMVRFKRGSGQVDTADRRLALVLDVVGAKTFRSTAPWTTERIDLAQDPSLAAKRLAMRIDEGQFPATQAARLLGDLSIDTVLVRPIGEVALYREARLAGGIGAKGVNKTTGTLYAPAVTGASDPLPHVDLSLFAVGRSEDDVQRDIGLWLLGRFPQTGSTTGFAPSDARLFTLSSYLGQLQEIRP